VTRIVRDVVDNRRDGAAAQPHEIVKELENGGARGLSEHADQA
jgi:hypothetical protein